MLYECNSYLHNRCQSVILNSVQSDYLIVKNGVPQGSCQGPLLFSIFINDLPKSCSNCQIHLYADDTYTSGVNRSVTERSLQGEFDIVQKWCSSCRIAELLLPILDYADVVVETHLQPLNVTYNSLCRFVLRYPYRIHHFSMYETLNWLPLSARRLYHWVQCIFKYIQFSCPSNVKIYLIPYTSSYSLWHTQQPLFFVPLNKKEIGRCAFKFKASSDWNNFNIKTLNSLHLFTKNSWSYSNAFFYP